MTERIDHVAEALGLLEFERHESELGFETADAQHLANYLEAKVHATLALVEQQRIANLIAWTTANGSEPNEVVSREIEEALGL